jgi:hypothetical protein
VPSDLEQPATAAATREALRPTTNRPAQRRPAAGLLRQHSRSGPRALIPVEGSRGVRPMTLAQRLGGMSLGVSRCWRAASPVARRHVALGGGIGLVGADVLDESLRLQLAVSSQAVIAGYSQPYWQTPLLHWD